MSSAKHSRISVDDKLDAVFHALGDRTRRRLLARLTKEPAVVITDLASPFAMSLPAVSRHIRVLESAGLITRSIDGRKHRCSLNAGPLKSAEAWLDHYRRFWNENLASLANYIENSND